MQISSSRKNATGKFLALAVIAGASIASASAQGPGGMPVVAPPSQSGSPMLQQNVTMTMFKVIDRKGKHFLETQSGEMLPISGKQLDKSATMLAVYRDANANYWFINKDGQPTAIPPDKVQWAINSISEQRYAKENNYPNAAPPGSSSSTNGNTTVNNYNGSSGGSGAGGAAVMGMSAMAGGMLGGMIGSSMYDNNHYYGIPYGKPMYHDGNRGYYYSNNKKVYVNTQKTAVAPVMNQWSQQGDWNHKNDWATNMQQHPNTNQWANQQHPNNNFGGTHPTTAPTGGEKLGSDRFGGGGFGGGDRGWGGFRGRRR